MEWLDDFIIYALVFFAGAIFESVTRRDYTHNDQPPIDPNLIGGPK